MSWEVPLIILVIGAIIFFFSIKVLKKIGIKNEYKRSLIASVITLSLSPIIYVCSIVFLIFSVSFYSEKDFNQKEWITNIEERYKMSEDIIDSEMLIGKTKEEVIKILGKPEGNRENYLNYYLGFVPGLLNIDPDVLDIYFENGKVVKVKQHET